MKLITSKTLSCYFQNVYLLVSVLVADGEADADAGVWKTVRCRQNKLT